MSHVKEGREWFLAFHESMKEDEVKTWIFLYSRTFPHSYKALAKITMNLRCDRVQYFYAHQFRDVFYEAFNNVFTEDEKEKIWWNTYNKPLRWSMYFPFLTSGVIYKGKKKLEKIEKNLIEIFNNTFPVDDENVYRYSLRG